MNITSLTSAPGPRIALDFGVSCYRTRQQGDQFLISEERRRKVVQNMLQDVRAAYWRALGAQRLNAQADDVLQKASLARSREAETQKSSRPAWPWPISVPCSTLPCCSTSAARTWSSPNANSPP